MAVFLATASVGGTALVFGCSSSDRPPGAGDTTATPTAEGGPALVDARRAEDVGRDQEEDALDAATPQFSDDGSCLNDMPAPTIDGGFTGGDDAGVPICPTTGTCVTHCNDIVARYKLGLAQVIVTCLRQLPSCSQVLDVQLCVDNALMGACQDTTAPAACTPLVLPCDPNAGGFGSIIDQNGCETVMRGLNPTGRGAFASCIQTKIDAGTCASQVDQCTDQIRQ